MIEKIDPAEDIWQEMDNPHRAGRIRELDGWRAVAASMVVVSHVGHQHARSIERFPWLHSVVNSAGYLGVQIFFVISGFVICRLLLREEARYGTFSLKAFYIRRAFRILPPFYFYLGVLALLAWFGVVEIPVRYFAKSALFLADFHSQSDLWFTGHSWSLAVEEQFYLFFPAILLLTPRRWRGAMGGMIYALFIAWALAASFMQGTLFLSAGIIAGFICIFCGVLIALHEERARDMTRNIPPIVVVLAATLLMLQPGFHLNYWTIALYESLLVPPVIAIMLLSTVSKPSWIQSVLCWRPVQAVGVTSYALYLWQELFTARKDQYSHHCIPYFLPLLCLIVPLSWTLIEKPAMRVGRNLSRATLLKSDQGKVRSESLVH